MELKDARVQYFAEHDLLQYHLVFESMKDRTQDMVRYMRTARALGLKLIQVKLSSGITTTKELDANYSQSGDTVVLVGFISDCVDAKQITFNLPPLTSVWNIYKGERAIVVNNHSSELTLIDWGRAKGANANVTFKPLTKLEAEYTVSKGKWIPESFIGAGMNITMSIMDRSFKEQIGVEALMLLTATPIAVVEMVC